MNSPVEQIKERLSIEEVVSSYIKLERAGANLKARCPFHNEKTPSFFVSPDRGSFYCFGCGAKGDIFTFIEEFEGLDFKGSLKILADRAGVKLGGYSRENEGEKERLYKAMEEATMFYEEKLSNSPVVKDYLLKRGIEEKTIKDFRVGYVPMDWRLLFDHMKARGFKDEELLKAGLIKKSEKSDSKNPKYYDRFRGRIMFPIGDSSGRIIAFSGRIFEDDGKSAKYLNSPDTPIFNKSAILYGLDKAKESIRKNNFSILVEGQMDLILSHQAGYRNTVATSGTALSDVTISKNNIVSNLGLIRRLSGNIVLAFDADKAGFNAASRAAKIALSLGMDVKVVELDLGVDPADIIHKEGKDAWRKAVRESKHFIEFILNRAIKDSGEDIRKMGRNIKDKVLPYVASLESNIEQAHFLQKISLASGIKEEDLREDLFKIKKETDSDKEEIAQVEKKEKSLFRKDYIERRLFGILFWQNSLSKPNLDVGELEQILNDIFSDQKEEILKRFEKDKEDLIFEAEVFYSDIKSLKRELEELITNLKIEKLKEKLFNSMRNLQKFEKENNKEKVHQTLREINDINKQIQNIKSGRINN